LKDGNARELGILFLDRIEVVWIVFLNRSVEGLLKNGDISCRIQLFFLEIKMDAVDVYFFKALVLEFIPVLVQIEFRRYCFDPGTGGKKNEK
jgi:hypothetical protein